MVIKGTLSIHFTKKNSKEFKANFTNAKGKTICMPILQQARAFRENEAQEGDSLNIEMNDKGGLAKVSIPGKEEVITPVQQPKTKPTREGSYYGYHGTSPARGKSPQPEKLPAPATAPYNFIPQDCLLDANLERWDGRPHAPKSPVADTPRYSGTLHCRLKTLTPLLVGGSQLQKSTSEQASTKSFFRVDGKPVIPGTSLKGMVRSVVETLTCSSMRLMNDHHIFWRNFDDTAYKAKFHMGSVDSQSEGPQQAGYLVRRGADFYIYPVKYKKIVQDSPVAPGHIRVSTGPMKRKKHDYDFFPFKASEDHLAVSEDRMDKIMEDFLLQLTPKQQNIYFVWNIKTGTGLPAHEQKIRSMSRDECLPVFYITNSIGELEFLGLPRFFRVPKKYSPRELCDKTLKIKGDLPDDFTDFSDQLFGYARKQQSRKGHVAFSPAVFDQVPVPLTTLPAIVLGQPHETCFAHYLRQDSTKLKTLPRNHDRFNVNSMSNYNDADEVRGRKYYWHRGFELKGLAEAGSDNNNKKTQSILQPLPENTTATFDVHLDSVSLVQLGAILTALRLPEGHAHKLGMGKSLGLGSVRIDLISSDVCSDADRYSDLSIRCAALFTRQKTALSLPEELLGEAEDAFRAKLLKGLTGKNGDLKDFENLPHIRALRAMMDFKGHPSNCNTQNMKLEEFKALRILPKAEDVRREGR